jgi:polyisoprenyl-teichoic acid--peptidoglycan teichoic acid transferase
MATNNPSRPVRRAAKPAGGSRAWPIVITVLVLLVGGWALKTFMLEGGQAKNILLMGVDADKTRTDVVILAHLDPKFGLVNLLSIPRDTWVDIDCKGLKPCQTPDKLAHAHVWGGENGPETTVATVEHFLGVQIDSYVQVDFEGFRHLVDALGGVDMVIDQEMNYVDPTPPGLTIHFKASKQPQHLNGQKALEYVRFRADGLGDVGRTERTRKFLHAVLEAARQKGTVTQVPAMWRAMAPYVKTNVDDGTIATLARMGTKLDPAKAQMAMVPGTPVTLKSGPWVWQADVPKTQALVDSLIKHPKPDQATSAAR